MNPTPVPTENNRSSKKEGDNLRNFDIEELTQLLKVLSEPNRLSLLEKIIEGVQCNCELGKSLAIAPNLVSHHLTVLCGSGIVEARRDEIDARWIYYTINKEKFRQIKKHVTFFFDEARIKPCMSSCGPNSQRKKC